MTTRKANHAPKRIRTGSLAVFGKNNDGPNSDGLQPNSNDLQQIQHSTTIAIKGSKSPINLLKTADLESRVVGATPFPNKVKGCFVDDTWAHTGIMGQEIE